LKCLERFLSKMVLPVVYFEVVRSRTGGGVGYCKNFTGYNIRRDLYIPFNYTTG
jgi:hypothetical protein